MCRAALVLVCVAHASNLVAQSPVSPVPATFDVVSIKRNTTVGPTLFNFVGGRYTMVRGPIASLVRSAYPAETNELVGAPDWVRVELYDVTAVAEGNPTREQLTPLMRAMLGERFKLKAHYERQERPIYSLVLARVDGKLGPEIRRSPLDCDAVVAAIRAGRAFDGPQPANGAPPCGMSMQAGTMQVGGLSMVDFARNISGAAGRVVIDKTGLEGHYEFTLRYSTQALAGGAAADDTPTIFTALQEQLGLKLESEKAPLQVVVIDQIERPSED